MLPATGASAVSLAPVGTFNKRTGWATGTTRRPASTSITPPIPRRARSGRRRRSARPLESPHGGRRACRARPSLGLRCRNRRKGRRESEDEANRGRAFRVLVERRTLVRIRSTVRGGSERRIRPRYSVSYKRRLLPCSGRPTETGGAVTSWSARRRSQGAGTPAMRLVLVRTQSGPMGTGAR